MKHKKHEEHENLERWLVSYADFITLMFAFFTVLYATSQTDKAKYQSTMESIQRAFLSSGGIFPLKGTPFTPFQKPPDKGSTVPPSPQDAGKFSVEDKEALDRIAYQLRGVFERNTGFSAHPEDLEVFRTENGFKIRLGERVLFKPNSDKIRRESVGFLYEMGKRLGRLGANIQVEGHTDNQSPSGSENNWQLSLNRSYNVVKFFVEGSRYPKDLVSVAGYGDTRPLADNDSPDGRARNRRVEISVITEREIAKLPW